MARLAPGIRVSTEQRTGPNEIEMTVGLRWWVYVVIAGINAAVRLVRLGLRVLRWGLGDPGAFDLIISADRD